MHSYSKMTFLCKNMLFLYAFLVQNACYEKLGDKPRGFDEHKWNFTKMYVESLQFETKSLMSEASDSAIGTEGAPSECDVDIGGQYRKVKITKLSFFDDDNNNNNNNNNDNNDNNDNNNNNNNNNNKTLFMLSSHSGSNKHHQTNSLLISIDIQRIQNDCPIASDG